MRMRNFFISCPFLFCAANSFSSEFATKNLCCKGRLRWLLLGFWHSPLGAKCVCVCCNAFKQTRLCKQIFNYDEIIIQFFTFVAKICKIFKKSVTKNHKKGLQRLKIWAGGAAFVFLWNFLGLCLGLGNFFGFVEFLGFVWNVLGNFLGICLFFFKILGRF